MGSGRAGLQRRLSASAPLAGPAREDTRRCTHPGVTERLPRYRRARAAPESLCPGTLPGTAARPAPLTRRAVRARVPCDFAVSVLDSLAPRIY